MIEQGTIKASVSPTFFVVVHKFKFDNIRQESYWAVVNTLCKQCKNQEQAEQYVERVTK